MKHQALGDHNDHDHEHVQKLLTLALELRELDEYATLPDAMKKARAELRKIVRKCLQQRKEGTLIESIEFAREEDDAAAHVLKAQIEDLSENVVFRRDAHDGGPDVEVNAFVIPLFVRSTGGLREDQCFQDEQAFDALRESLQTCGLESAQAKVVLVAHAYHPDEIAQIGYCTINAMAHEAHLAMTRKKAPAAPTIAASVRGWPANGFAPDDVALELRFLLGFALKTLDDPFYAAPADEVAADLYFAARAKRFQHWTETALPLLKRCLATDGREIEVDFLYQDLFFGGTAAAFAEQAMLQLLSELKQALDGSGVAPDTIQAIVGPADADDERMLRVHLLAGEDVLASADKPLADTHNWRPEAEDVCDALRGLGIGTLAIARRFDADDRPHDVRAFTPRASQIT